MLTVKHITMGGNEYLYQAYEVRFDIPLRDDTSTTPYKTMQTSTREIVSRHSGGSLTLTRPSMSPGELGSYEFGLQGGTIFVMNDLGKTVARYDLGASPVPYDIAA